MRIVYDSDFISKLKKINVRVRKSFKERILLFSRDPNNPQLNNHPLLDEYQGCRSIDITSDWRAIYKDTEIEDKTVTYFIILGTHKDLYRKN